MHCRRIVEAEIGQFSHLACGKSNCYNSISLKERKIKLLYPWNTSDSSCKLLVHIFEQFLNMQYHVLEY